MTYAFLFGSNAFFVNKPVISSSIDGQHTALVSIASVYRPASGGRQESSLVVNSNVKGTRDNTICLADNTYIHPEYRVDITPNQVHVTDSSGNTVLDVLQLLPEAIEGLSSHVLNELHNIGEAIVIRLRGDFMAGQHHITIDNEKLYIDDDVYAESVQVGHNGVEFGPNGVII